MHFVCMFTTLLIWECNRLTDYFLEHGVIVHQSNELTETDSMVQSQGLDRLSLQTYDPIYPCTPDPGNTGESDRKSAKRDDPVYVST